MKMRWRVRGAAAGALGLVGASAVCMVGCASRSAPEAPADSAAGGDAKASEAPSPARAAAPAAAPVEEAPRSAAQTTEFEARPEKDDSAAVPKKKEGTSRLELADEMSALDHAIAPEQLSCAGARPHRDAICSIAERLCETPAQGTPTVGPDATCQEARDSCAKAKSKFKARCGSD